LISLLNKYFYFFLFNFFLVKILGKKMVVPEICCLTMTDAVNLIHRINSTFPEILEASLMFDDCNYVRLERQHRYLSKEAFYEKALCKLVTNILPKANITVLNFAYHTFNEQQVDALVKLLLTKPQTLTHFIITRSKMNLDAVTAILRALPPLKMFNMERICPPTYATLFYSFDGAWLPFLNVVDLRLQDNYIDDRAVCVLVDVLMNGLNDYALEKLDLSYNRIGDQGAKAFASLLKANLNDHLLTLHLDYNLFTVTGLLELLWSVNENTTLLEFNLNSTLHVSFIMQDVFYKQAMQSILLNNKTLIHFSPASINDPYRMRNIKLREKEWWRPYIPRGPFFSLPPLCAILLLNSRFLPSLPMDIWLIIFGFFQRGAVHEIEEIDD